MHRLAYGQYLINNMDTPLGVSQISNLPEPPPPVPVILGPPPYIVTPILCVTRKASTHLDLQFTVVPVDIEDNTYVILVDRRVTRGEDDRVFAFENKPAQVWAINYREAEQAYTIDECWELIQRYLSIEVRTLIGPPEPYGWTAPSRDEPQHMGQILLCLFVEPRPEQLFKFERVHLE
ncbi:hypothetical protein EDC04DRAFT_2610610 [Pisolithus marmoratus]|nr:hypothetical protein EDC04DRAFT_2610610 [Pisolithus marmoratus]